ncbi:MAG: ABC transporter permease, partial [Synergistaceae bacterium]|nr:ABC transporter permease [Synergistaceae bacterium]
MFFKLMRRNLLFSVGVVICVFWLSAAVLAPYIAPYDPLSQNLSVRFSPPGSSHWFGCDSLGRDVFSRVLLGSRLSIIAGLMTITFAAGIGGVYGGMAGYIGGWVDDLMMRASEMVMAFPSIILAMTIAAALGPSLYNTLLAMVIIWWPNYARIMRGMVIACKENDYVVAAHSLGASHFRIFFEEILPNCLGQILVVATLDFGNAVLLFSTLSFLGLGSPPPVPEWGAMVADGVKNFNYWWIGTFPGLV